MKKGLTAPEMVALYHRNNRAMDRLLRIQRDQENATKQQELNIFSTAAPSPDKTMSSREIAELTGKLHKNVMSDIRNILKQAGVPIGSDLSYQQNQGVTYEICPQTKRIACYNLPRRECDLVISGYSVKYRLTIIDRWRELEAKQQVSLPSNYIEALEALVGSEKEKQALTAENAELKPQAVAFEALTRVSGTISISNYHKLLQSEYGITAIQKEVRQWLNDEGYIFKRDGAWHRYACHSDKFEEKLVPWSNNRGYSWVVYLTEKGIRLITPKIVEYFQ